MKPKTLIISGGVIFFGLLGFLWFYNQDGRGLNGPVGGHSRIPTISRPAPAAGALSSGQVAGSQLAPDFTLATLDGGKISLADYRGDKPVVLDFWASWCPNCRRDMPKLNALYQKYQHQVEVIGINLQENPATIQNYISRAGIEFPIVLDPAGQASRLYGVRYTNYHVLISKDGAIVRTIPGDIREADFTALLDS